MTAYMDMRSKIIVLSIAALISMTSVAFAQTEDPVPVQQQGTVKFMTGGIGDDERTALEAARSDYNLHVTNAAADGAFMEDITLTINDSHGTALASIDAGPLTNVSLPAGKYTLTASHGGSEQKKTVKLATRGATKAHFTWK